MTPRVGVKTTLTMERAFSGFPVPSGNPTFLPLIDARSFAKAYPHPRILHQSAFEWVFMHVLQLLLRYTGSAFRELRKQWQRLPCRRSVLMDQRLQNVYLTSEIC